LLTHTFAVAMEHHQLSESACEPVNLTLDDVVEVLENDLDYVLVSAATELPGPTPESTSTSGDKSNEQPSSHVESSTNFYEHESTSASGDKSIEQASPQVESSTSFYEHLTEELNDKNVKFCCQICGNAANGHSYYGAKTCGSCRAFFKRAALVKDSLICSSGQGSCVKKCRKCRFDKCLAIGMDPTLVIKRISKNTMSTPSMSLANYFTIEDEIEMRGLASMSVTWEAEFMMTHLLPEADYDEVERFVKEDVTFPIFCSQNADQEYNYYSFVQPKYLNLPSFKRLNRKEAEYSFREWFPPASELCLTFSVKASEAGTVVPSFHHEFYNWLKKQDGSASVSVPDTLKRVLMRCFPKMATFDQAYGKVPPEMARRHRELVQHIVKLMGMLDTVTYVLVEMTVLMKADSLTRNHYIKLLYGYLKQHPNVISINHQEFISLVMALPDKLKEMRQLRTTAYERYDL